MTATMESSQMSRQEARSGAYFLCSCQKRFVGDSWCSGWCSGLVEKVLTR